MTRAFVDFLQEARKGVLMKRRDFIAGSGALVAGIAAAGASRAYEKRETGDFPRIDHAANEEIRVAFAMANGATVIDFAGPWEVFQDVMIPSPGGTRMPFELFTVGESRESVRATGGLHIIPDYTFETAPTPNVIVVPALRGSDALLEWLRKTHEKTDITTSVCTGAFQLARAGLLNGKSATTHHDFLDRLESSFPEIDVRRGVRLVDNGDIATAGGLTSGIDMALRVVARYFGPEVAETTAFYMEYEGKGWRS
jgi:transcriptional regulator GlxA family with amidase domain